jgi:hypothetical protein
MSDLEMTGLACLRCKRELVSLGSHEIRMGGTPGFAKLFFGEWAELGESKFPAWILACDECGYVELQLRQKDREKLAQQRPR